MDVRNPFFGVYMVMVSNEQEVVVRTRSGQEYAGVGLPLAEDAVDHIILDRSRRGQSMALIRVRDIEAYWRANP